MDHISVSPFWGGLVWTGLGRVRRGFGKAQPYSTQEVRQWWCLRGYTCATTFTKSSSSLALVNNLDGYAQTEQTGNNSTISRPVEPHVVCEQHRVSIHMSQRRRTLNILSGHSSAGMQGGLLAQIANHSSASDIAEQPPVLHV